jgi:nitrite reductase/ring-hydroxylating ferredoxin subunit
MPGTRRESSVLIATGLMSAVPTAAAGLTDWSQLRRQQQRTGLLHAMSNVTALALYGASLAARLRGRDATGRALGFAGLGAVTLGGLLGGHLSYRQAAGANHAEHVPYVVDEGWHLLGRLDELPDGEPTLRTVDGLELFVLRRGERVSVLGDACSHLSGPLHEGRLGEVDGAACITCPWHGSTFRVDDGSVVTGPATASQPAFEVAVNAGEVRVRPPVP